MYVKSRETAKNVVNMGTRVEIIRKEKKTSFVCTARKMDTLLQNVTSRRGMGRNALFVTRRVTKKRSSGRNKKMTKINKKKRLISLKRCIMMSYFLEITHLRAKIKISTRKLSKFSLLTQGLCHTL